MSTPSLRRRGSAERSRTRRLLKELSDLRTRFGGTQTLPHQKQELLQALRGAVFQKPEHLLAYHDALLFMRAYPDTATIAKEAERQLRALARRVAACRRIAGDAAEEALLDSGLVDTAVAHVFSYRLAVALAERFPRRIDIDWDSYWESASSDLSVALSPAMLWHELEAIDNDEDFNEQSWLELSRTRRDPTCLKALLTLLGSSGLSEPIRESLYTGAEIPLRWELSGAPVSRTLRRIPWRRPFYQTDPLLGRTQDLRGDLRSPAPPLRHLPRHRGEAYVRAIQEVLGARVRELYPLTGANPGEVYLHEPGRGVQIVVYGSLPPVRLPHETNMGAMLVRNGVPIGYGVTALLFDRAEIAINVFPTYRAGESAWLITQFLRLFASHFGSRVLLVRSFQVGDDNEEGLESGAFWFYHKLGFRPVKPRVRALARKESRRIAMDRRYRSPLSMLKHLARSDLFFHLDETRMDRFEELNVADLGYALTRRIAREYGGDREKATEGSVRRLQRLLGLRGLDRWSADERAGLHRMAPLAASIPDLAAWSSAERTLLARLLRAKGGPREKEFHRLASTHRKFQQALRKMATEERRRRSE